MLGNFGNAILLICTLLLLALVGTYLLGLAARCLLVVIQGTANGENEITWPDEPMMDWLLNSVHVAALILLWLLPIGFVSRGLGKVWLEQDPGLRFLLLAVPGLWFFFPIALLSSLSTSSRWVIFRPAIVGGMLRELPNVLLFYLLTAALSLGVSALWYLALFSPASYTVPLAAIVGAAGVLIYARLLGRVAWLLHRLNLEKRRKPVRKRRPLPAESHDPWGATEIDPEPEPEVEPEPPAEPESELEPPRKKGKVRSAYGEEMDELEGYGLAKEAPPPVEKSPLRRTSPPEEDAEPMALRPKEPEDADNWKTLPTEPDAATRTAIEMRERKPPAPPPTWPMFSNVLPFVLTGNSLRALVWLSCGGLVVGFLLRFLFQLVPQMV